MSVMGTGIAAAVAQTAQQAQQVARKRDKQTRQARDAADRNRELFESHLQIFEENDQTESSARLRVEADLHHAAPAAQYIPGQGEQSHPSPGAPASPTPQTPPQSPYQPPHQAATPLPPAPSHLDIEA